ncbi:Os10g0378075 [Oryza sativa Japonica Group]|uniref:Os10g0378075 protein n=2 Tax=Oryza TaxID=4527 RepID=C7J7B9_ORYSJ|nr:Os10g0378075 [Oryza sativa Japonica Group]|eukprot:NP_001176126.1 Os10g0378075 [Oryza sativa Japonica Group]
MPPRGKMMPIGVVNIATARRPGVMLSPWALKTVDYRCLAHHLAQQLNFATTQDDTTLEEQTLLIHPCCHQSSLKDITAPSVGLGCGR